MITVAFFPLCGESVLSYPSGRMPSRVREEEEEEEEEAEEAEENLIRYSIAEMLARWSSGKAKKCSVAIDPKKQKEMEALA